MIKTTHVGSLPRPAEMITRQLKKEIISTEDIQSYVAELIRRQISLGLNFINNGELPRSDYINATVQRIAGFSGTCIAPIPQDLEELPDYARRFGGRNGLITLNPKAPVKLPSCNSELSYTGEDSLRQELEMMVDAYQSVKGTSADPETGLFFTAPSPGTIALFLENNYYSNYEEYIQHLATILQKEYEIINSYDVAVQIDCPDLAMGRHTRYKHLEDDQFLSLIDININYLNRALEKIDAEKCRAHICWGNYPGTHHCDVGLETIFNHIMRLSPKYISLESCNHRHAHEWQLFNQLDFPEDKVLMPGVVDTTSNTVEHPELVAYRLINFARILGTERVVGSTDCGFASTASATTVSGEVAWLKLQSLVDGAKLASSKLSPG